MIFYLTGMEPYYIQCIKDGPFKPKTAEGDDKPESQWIPKERRVVNQDQRLKSIIISCLSDDIMELVISCETAKATWTDLVHSFEGPSNTKENRIMDLKLNLPEKWLSFSQGLRNANHTQTLDLADIYGRFDSQENSDDEADERSCEEYLRDLELEFHKRALLKNSKRFIKRKNNFSVQKENEDTKLSKGLQPKFTPKFIQSSQHAQSSQGEPKVQKDYKAEYKKMKAKLALLEANEEEVSDDEEETQIKVLMDLAADELSMGKNHARNDE
ncbi:hypothetical protein Tco_1400218 [Tanacetum coccineum]